MKKLRVALIGTGQVATTTHLPNILTLPYVEIAGLCDINSACVKSAAEKFSIGMHYTDYTSMLETLKPDAVLISVSNKYHFQTTMDCLNKGCHVLCEKPPAVTAWEAKQMEELAAEKGLILSYGFHFRHSRKIAFLKNQISRGEFGKIYSSRAVWHRRRGVPGWGNFTNREIQGGGPLIDLGSHMLDLAFYLLDYKKISYLCASSSDLLAKSSEVYLMGKYEKKNFTVEDSLFGFIMFEDSSSLIIETSFALNMKDKDRRNLELMGDLKGAQLYPLEIFGESDGKLIDEKLDALDEQEPLHLKSLINFCQACMGKGELLVTAHQGTYVQRVLNELYRSAESRQPVFFTRGTDELHLFKDTK